MSGYRPGDTDSSSMINGVAHSGVASPHPAVSIRKVRHQGLAFGRCQRLHAWRDHATILWSSCNGSHVLGCRTGRGRASEGQCLQRF